MSATKELTILAVTKMHGGVCTAGIDADGHWVRPVRPIDARASRYETITDYCLLPLDFFHGGQSHLANLGVTRFFLSEASPQPPHVEDWMMDLRRKPQLIRRLTQDEQSAFLAAHVESGASLLAAEPARSLALIHPLAFSFSFGWNQTGDDVAVRASFKTSEVEVGDAGCTDLRLRALGRRLLEKSGGKACSLDQTDFERQGKAATYLAIGLSRLYRNKHWPILVGVHSLPELTVEVDYARL
ncbi:MAG: dual OB domain-containing protein [Blastocatellia bacterium]